MSDTRSNILSAASAPRNLPIVRFWRRGHVSISTEEDRDLVTGRILSREEGNLPETEDEEDRLEMLNFNDHSCNTFTVEEAVNSIGFGRYHLRLSLFCGMIWMADAMEMMVLVTLGPEARCDFNLYSWQEALITTVVFIGMMSGSFWGWFMDKYGRKKGLVVVVSFMAYFGLLSAFSVSYGWLLFLRFLVGFGIGGAPMSTAFYCEFLPAKSRAAALIIIQVWWSLGVMFQVGLAWLVIRSLGWHYLLAFSTVFLFVVLIMSPAIHPSPRFYTLCGDLAKAHQILEKIARENGRRLPPGRLVSDEEKQRLKESDDSSALASADENECVSEHTVLSVQLTNSSSRRAQFRELVRQKMMLKATILISLIWFTGMCSYFGLVLMTTEIQEVYNTLAKPGGPGNSSCVDHVGEASKSEECVRLTKSDYMRTIFASLAEFPAIILSAILVIVLGRKKTLFIMFIGGAVSFGLTLFCQVSRNAMIVLLFGVRTFLSGAFVCVFVYTPEVFPTSVRSIGLGVCSTVGRLGAIITPFIAQLFLRQSIIGTKIIYMALCMVAAVASLLLPIETKGRPLQETADVM